MFSASHRVSHSFGPGSRVCEVALAHLLLNPDTQYLSHLPSPCIDKVALLLSHRGGFTAYKTIIDSSCALQKDGIGRYQLLTTNDEFIALPDMLKQYALFDLLINFSYRNGEVGLVIAIEESAS